MNKPHNALPGPHERQAFFDRIQALLPQHAQPLNDDTQLIEQGLDSLQVMRLASQLRQAGARVSFASLIEDPRPGAWWAQLGAGADAVAPPTEVALQQAKFDLTAPFPLTDVQHAYWIGREDDQVLGGVGCHAYLELDGPFLNPHRLEGAWHALLLRHGMLRAYFGDDGLQRIGDTAQRPTLTCHDLADTSAEVRDNALADTRKRLSHRRLDVRHGHMLGMELSLLSEGRSRLHVDVDLLAADVHSLHVLLRDLAALYADPHGNGLPDTCAWHFGRYLRDMNSARQAQRDTARAWWHERLPSLPGGPDLPLACAPATLERPHFSRREFRLSQGDWQRLRQGAAAQRLTPAALLMSAYAQVLARWSSQSRFLINVPLFDRQLEQSETLNDVVADFTSLVLLECDFSQPQSFAAQARQLQRQLHADVAHGSYSGVSVLRDLARLRPDEALAAPVVFACNLGTPLLTRHSREHLGDLHYMISQTPQVWLDHQVYEEDGGLLLAWDAVDAIFPDGMLDEMFSAYTALLEGLAQEPAFWDQQPLAMLPAAQAQVRSRVNATAQAQRPRALQTDVFEQALRQPQAIALLHGENTLSFADLSQRALAVAACLRDAGLQLQDPVAVSLPRGPEQVIAVLGVLAAGGCYVPVGVHQPASRRSRIHRSAGVRHVLCSHAQWPELEADDAALRIDIRQAQAFMPLAQPVSVDPTGPAYVIFTSGSTGEPKGVQISHQAAINTIDDLNRRYGIGPQTRGLAVSALDFDLSVYDLFGVLGAGGSLVLVSEEQHRDAAAWLKLVQEHQVNLWNSVPVLLDMLLVVARQEQAQLPLRQVMLSGDWIGLDLPGRLHQRAADAQLIAMGGATEASIWSNVFDVPCELPNHWTSIPYGQPLGNQQYRVVDAQGRDCPDWVAGELWIGGAGVADGYRGAPELTTQRFVEHDGLRWYRTGDRGRYWPDGNLEFLGRLDHQVKVRGHRIELGEIETALTALPGVQHAVAVTVGSPASLAAALVLDADTTLDIEACKRALRQSLPEYMVPSTLIALAQLPLSANGKVDRKQITVLLADSAETPTVFEAPHTGPEAQVASVWEALLHKRPIGRQQNFFALGGDSLLATQAVARLKAEGLGHPQALRTLFANPVLADFASHLLTHEACDEVLQVQADLANRHLPFPLTEVQRAYWMGQSSGLSLSCGTRYLVELDGQDVDLDRIERTWNQLVQQHEMLRAVIDEDGQQRIVENVEPTRIHRRNAETAQLEACVQLAWEFPAQQLHHLHAIFYGERRCRLVIVFNYMTLDGYSIKLLLEQLAQRYQQPEILAPAPGLSFRDYVQQVVHSPSAIERAQAYWQARLADLPNAAALPLACDPQTVKQVQFNRRQSVLDAEHWQALCQRARAHNLTPSVLLLTAYSHILSQWSGGVAHTVNLTLFDRQPVHPDIDRVLGDFTSLAPVAFMPQAQGGLLAHAQGMQQGIVDALEHREVSSIWIQRERSRTTDLTSAALPVVFTSTLGLGGGLFESPSQGFPAMIPGGRSETPQVWLDHQLYEYQGQLVLTWDSVDALFQPGVLDAMFDAYLQLLGRLRDESWETPLALPLPPAQSAVREQANATAQAARPRSVNGDIFLHALRQPQAIALLHAEDALSFADLSQRALAVAACLRDTGLQPQDPVAVSLPRGPEQVIAVLGVLAAGGCYVPVGVHQPASRRSRIHRSADVRHVLCSHEQWPDLEADDAALRIDIQQAQAFAPLAEPVTIDPASPAYVIFTSGSTGEPKGVQISHQAAINTIDDLNRRYGIGPKTRGIAVSALDFDLSVYDLFGVLGAGGSLVLVSEEQHRDAAAWLKLVQEHQVNLWNSVPVLLDMLLVVARQEQAQLPLRQVMLSGDWIGLDLPGRLHQLAPDAQLIAMGGATEASIWSNVFDVPRELPSHWTSIPYGQPLGNQQYRVVDAQGRDCPDWVAGELWIGGAGVADGYRGAPELTTQRFVEHDGLRWYRTGDRGRYWPDGNLEFLGRLDHQVKVRGHRIELGEIETALTTLPGVHHAVAVTIGSPASLAAALVLDTHTTLDIEACKQALRQSLPEYMVPSTLIALAQLPLSANGKVDRKQITGLLAATVSTPEAFEAPQGAREIQVAAVWEALLNKRPVGRQQNFFALGGDSLLATQVIARLKSLGLASSEGLRALFASPVLADFAACLQQQDPGEGPQQLQANPAQRYQPFALSEVQSAYWMGQHNDLPLACATRYLLELDGDHLDLPRLETAWNVLVQRHDMLRVVFTSDQRQRVLPQVEPLRITVDSQPAASLEHARTRLQRIWETRPADAPLFALHAIGYGERRCRLGLFLDYMAVDGYSIKLLLNELALLFANPEQALPSIGIGFRDYLEQVRHEPQALQRAQDYWHTKAAQLPGAAALPLANDPQTLASVRFRRHSARLDATTWQRLRQRAREHGITPSVLVLVAYAQVLSRWSGGAAHTLNMTLFDRQDVHPDIHRVLGDFTSLAPVAFDPANGPAVLDQARAVQRDIAEALEYRQVSSIAVQRERARQLGRASAALPVVFTSTLGIADSLFDQPLPEGFPQLADGGLSQTPQVWLDHQMYEHQGELLYSWDVVEDLFPEGMIETMFAALGDLLQRMVTQDWHAPMNLDQPASQANVRSQVNATAQPQRPRALQADVFEQALRQPQAIALLHAESALSFADLSQRALAVAACLRDAGLQAQEPVAVSLPRGPEQVIAVLGVLAAGGCYVPVGAHQPASRRSRIHRSAGVRLVLCSQEQWPELETDDAANRLDIKQAQAFMPLAEPVSVDPKGPAYVIFTSGSTGEPKGVQISHQAAINTIDDLNRRYGIGPQTRGLAVSALDFDLSVYDLFGVLGAGGSLVLVSEEQHRDAAAWLRLVQEHQVNLWNSVPVLLDMLLVVAGQEQANLPLRQVMLSGDWIGLDLPERIHQLAPGSQLIAMGGATEASIWSNVFDVPRELPSHWTSIPYGQPLGNQQYRVVDAQGRDCPDWVAGELWIGGAGVADGYRGAPELTAQRFVEHDGLRWYRTGDRGRYWPDGNLEFLGRLDHQVKVRGHRIELGEIETALSTLPGVQHAVAVTVGSPASLAAALVLDADTTLDVETCKRALRQSLPAYMVPSTLIALEQLPLSANGKVDRKGLVQRLEAVTAGEGAFEAPMDGLESDIAQVWRTVLNRPKLSRHDDFFAIGGDSLSATRIVALLQQRVGPGAVSLRTLYASAPSVASMAAHVRAHWEMHQQPTACEPTVYEEGVL